MSDEYTDLGLPWHREHDSGIGWLVNVHNQIVDGDDAEEFIERVANAYHQDQELLREALPWLKAQSKPLEALPEIVAPLLVIIARIKALGDGE